MPESVIGRVAHARSLAAKIWKLAVPYWRTDAVAEFRLLGRTWRMPEKWLARGLLVVIIALNVFTVYLTKLFNSWNARFFNSLQDKDQGAFFASLKYWVVLAFIYIIVAVYKVWLRQLLTIRWRRWLTAAFQEAWLGDRTYYRMELVGHTTDNPEQRIEQDVDSFTNQTLVIGLTLINQVLTLGTFSVVLWNLSGDFTIPIFGGIVIPGYMMWVCILYAALGSWLTYAISRSLVLINFLMQRYNADFRYRMTRVREYAESIALYAGESDELRRLGGAFGRIYDNWWRYMQVNKRLTWLQSFYYQAANVFPFIVVSPRYFAGQIPLGVVTQTASAFGYVQESLSWFVDQWQTLADWGATVERLTTFSDTIQRAKRQAAADARELEIETVPQANLVLDDVAVLLPNGRALLEDVDLDIRPGQRIVLQGPSGSGKTTLFRVLAGIWPFATGRIRVPADSRVLFLPQKPYIPVGSLREALTYPDPVEAHGDAEILEALAICQLDHLADRLDETAIWSLTLSGGEQQRLSFARALLVRPDWLFLDEATSALDEASETALYQLLAERLPDATVVSIAHKPGVARFHEARLRIDPVRRRVVQEPLEAAAEPA